MNTLDSYHQKHIKKFNSKNILKLKKNLNNLEIKYLKLQKQDLSKCNNDEIKLIFKIKQDIKN